MSYFHCCLSQYFFPPKLHPLQFGNCVLLACDVDLNWIHSSQPSFQIPQTFMFGSMNYMKAS